MQSEKTRLVIVGGGIGGLTLAISISRLIPNFSSYLKIDIYEQTGSLQAQVGAGIGVWPHTWGIAEALGLDEDLSKLTNVPITDEPCTPFLFRKSDRTHGHDLFKLRTTGGDCLFFHRGHFQAVLLKHLPPSITIHTKKRLSSYTQNEGTVRLEFEDGSSTEADMVVGADGLQSRVRRTLVEELMKVSGPREYNRPAHHPADPLWSGILMYRALVSRERLIESGWGHHPLLSRGVVYGGSGDCIIAFPVNNGSQANFLVLKAWFEHEGTVFSNEKVEKLLKGQDVSTTSLAYAPPPEGENCAWMENGGGGQAAPGRGKWVERVSQEELRNVLAGWEPEVQAMVDLIDEPLRWALHTTPQLESYTHGKVCLLGDAGHAMHPHVGAGAGQAMTDGYIIASLLAAAISADPSNLKSSLTNILQVYNKARRLEAHRVASAARDNAHHFSHSVRNESVNDGNAWVDIDVDNEEETKLLYNRIVEAYSFSWDKHGAMKEADKAVNMFYTRISHH